MIENLIQRLIDEGKVTQEYIDEEIVALKKSQPNTREDILSIEKRQDATEIAIMAFMEFI